MKLSENFTEKVLQCRSDDNNRYTSYGSTGLSDLDASDRNVQIGHRLDCNGIKFGFHLKRSKIT